MKLKRKRRTRSSHAWRQRITGIAGSLLVVCAFVAAVYVLHRELRDYGLRDIEQRLSLLSWRQLLGGAALTAFSYVLLTGYDWLAIHYIDRSLPYRNIALASFISYVSSYNFGAILGGSTMRYRLYSTFGLSAVEIVKVIAICTLTFVLGWCSVAGVVFVTDPIPLPEVIKLPIATVYPIGIALLIAVAAYLVASALWHRPIIVRGWQLSLPTPGFTVLQMIVATADLMAAAGVLYTLLPVECTTSFPRFLGMFLMAQGLGIVSHVPGGLGVVEAVLMVALGPVDRAALMGSMVVYRITYYLLPLVVAIALLAAHEGFQQRERVASFAHLFGRWAPAVIPRVLAFATFAGGAMLMVYGALPRTVSRWHWLSDVVPLPVVELSHFAGSIAGMGLLLLARGLLERLDAAYHLVVFLLSCGIVVSLLRAFNLEEALILTVMLAALLPCKGYFDRRASLLNETLTPGWTTSIVLVLVGTIWIGIFAHKHVEYSHAMWWQFEFTDDAPRFMRASVGAALFLLVVGIARLLRPAEQKFHIPDEGELSSAAAIVAQSPRADAALALLGDKSFFFNADRTALVMYAIEGASWVALGDPIGPAADAAELAWRFRELCDRRAAWPVFYQAAAEYRPLYLDLGLSLLKLGERACVPLPHFGLDGGERRWMRHVLNKAEADGYTFEVLEPVEVEARLDELKRISDEWLAAHHAREKRFSCGFFQPDYFRRLPLALVLHKGRIAGFGNVWVAAARHELSVDLLRFRPDAESGLMDYLLIELMLWGRAAGYESFDLGMTPLAGLESGPLAPLWRRVGTTVFRHGEHFASFAELRAYKEKFDPQWDARYLASPGGLRLPRILSNVASLITGGASREA